MRLGLSRSIAILAAAAISVFSHSPAAQAQAQSIACGGEYTVVPGDTLNEVSSRAYGAGRSDEFFALNRDRIGADPNLLRTGLRLRVPCLDDATAAAPTPSAAAAPTPSADAAPTPSADAAPTPSADAAVGPANFDAAPDLADDAAPPPPGEVVEIVFNKASAPNFIMNVGIIDPLLADIERVTEGRVRFLDPAEVNRDPQAQLALVTSGAADGAYMFNGYLGDSHPLVQLTMHPMMGGTALQTAIALWRVHDRHFDKAGQFDDVHLLGFVGAPPAHIWRVSDVPVDERENLAGNNAWTVPYFEGLDTRGAPAVRSENAERIRLLDETPGLPPATYALAHGAARAVGVWTQSRTVTEIDGGVYAPTFSVFISKEKWDAIAPVDQRAIESLAGENLALRSAAWDAFDNGHKTFMLGEGLNVVQPDFELLSELQDRARISWEEWIKIADESGVKGFDAIQDFFAEMDKLRVQYPSLSPS